MEILVDRINRVKKEALGYGAKLVIATKYLDLDDTKKLAELGYLDLGANRVDTFLEKYEALKDYNINWHFFGIVQSRRVRDLANKITCLHSLDRLSLAMEFDKRLEQPLDCFIEINIRDEEGRNGVSLTKAKALVKSISQKCKNIRIIGLMCVAKMTIDEEELEREFSKVRKIKEEIEELGLENAPCHELSMGMSNDYQLALMNGATLIRVGRMFFR